MPQNLESPRQFGNRNAKSNCDPLDVPYRDVSLSPFDSADVGTVQSTAVGKGFLGQVQRLPQFPHAEPESSRYWLTMPHGPDRSRLAD